VPGIDNWGHIGGLIGGAVYTWFAGPVFSIIPDPPLFRLEDHRSNRQALYVFLALLIVIITLVVWIILSSS